MKTILVPTQNVPSMASTLATALLLAQRTGAHQLAGHAGHRRRAHLDDRAEIDARLRPVHAQGLQDAISCG